MSQPTTAAPHSTATQSPRSGCAYLVAAAIIGTAATTTWIGDMPIHHGVLLGAGIVAAIAGCAGVVRNYEAQNQYRIDQAREDGEAVGYAKGVKAALNDGSASPRLRSVP